MTRVGVDVSSVAQWRTRLDRTPALRGCAFARGEAAWCGDDAASYALAWAVKEAAVKLLGTGFDGIGWRGVWSRPGATGIEVVLGDDARAAPGARSLVAPLRLAVGRDDDSVVVALVAGRGDVCVRVLGFDPSGDRRARHRASRQAARVAADMAATALDPRPHMQRTWVTAPARPPVAVCGDGTHAAASVSHGRDLVCAAVALESGEPSSDRRQSENLMFTYDERLTRQLLRHLPLKSQTRW